MVRKFSPELIVQAVVSLQFDLHDDKTPGCAGIGPSGFVCTLIQGHDGNHVAHGGYIPLLGRHGVIVEWDGAGE